MLADLDRPVEQYAFPEWGRDVAMRAISAQQFVEVMSRLSAAGEDDTAAKITVFALICSYGIVDPACKADEWAADVRLGTLMHLGNKVLEITNRTHEEAAKKN